MNDNCLVTYSCFFPSSNEDDIDGVPIEDHNNSPTDSHSRDRNKSAKTSSSASLSNTSTASQILDQLKLSESDKRRKLREIEVSNSFDFLESFNFYE